MPEYVVFTDGACSGNPGPGGWGAIVVPPGGERRELSGYEPGTTNNRMELMAVLEGLSMVPNDGQVTVFSDSQYVINGARTWVDGWRKRGWKTSANGAVLNRDLWESIDAERSRLKIRWEWVRGHSGHPENERCDYLARRAITEAAGPAAAQATATRRLAPAQARATQRQQELFSD